MHHIGDANEFHIAGDLSLPLPIILWEKGVGLKTFMSSSFHHGASAIDGYVMDHGVVKKVLGDFPAGHHEVEVHHGEVLFEGAHFETEGKSTLLASSSFYDFSITKNVFALLMSISILLLVFIGMARFYKKGNMVPKGIYSALEPLVLFIKEDIAIPNIGEKKYAKFLPYLLTVFFFILINNLLGLVPFFPGSANLTGNIALTFVLALLTMIITNINGTKTYWGHIFNPPVPMALKPLMIPIELIGTITKPFALMIRLFANISAGHILILSLLSLIFIFKSFMVAPVSIAFVLFMSTLELLVAFLQAYIFTLLSALFIGLALEEHH
ncbi:MAG: F0F1 ATP synthase subunit A [Chitinophagales bacterium]|nr:F0F1 ATP synthase subunit A [Chitinophagales bacterium]